MEDKSKQDELIRFFEENNYDKAVIDQAKADFEYGLSAEQVSIYKVRRIKDAERSLISGAMRLKMPQELITNMVNHRYKEAQYAAVIGEYESGTELSVINDVMKEFRTGHDIKATFTQVKERMANSMEKPPEPEPEESIKEKTEPVAEDKPESPESPPKQEPAEPGVSSQDFMETMKMMMDTFSNTVQKQFERMDKRDEELRQSSLNKDAEKSLNDTIVRLEGELANSRKDLSAAAGVVSEREREIRRLKNDLEDRDKSIKDSLSEKEAEIKKLREEMEQMKAGESSRYSENTVAGTTSVPAFGNGNSNASAATASGNSDVFSNVSAATGNAMSQQVMGSAGTDKAYNGNYSTTMVMPDGRQIPIQVERMERKSSGLAALMSKLLPKGPAKTLLTRMIEGRYSGAQLSEVVYAYDKKLDEAEVQELLDANLPPEEMHGIIDVVAAAKGGEA
jgi:hypothetical protein